MDDIKIYDKKSFLIIWNENIKNNDILFLLTILL
jgi:hypothetical protein